MFGKKAVVLVLLGGLTFTIVCTVPNVSLAQQTDTVNNGFDSQKQQRINGLVQIISDRFDAAITRLLAISNRIESRQQKLANQNFATAEAKAYIQSAQADLQQAATLAGQTKDVTAAVLTAENPSEQWGNLKLHLTKIDKLINSAYNNLLRALNTLKNPVVPDQLNATSSATSSSQTEPDSGTNDATTQI